MKSRWKVWLALGALIALLALLTKKAIMTFKTRPEFVKALREALAGVSMEDMNAAEASRQIIAAVATHETGFGSGSIFSKSNNLFSLTKGSWTGPTITSGAKDPSGAPYVFRKYDTLAASAADFMKILRTLSRYNAALLYLKAGEAEKFFRALQAGGYGDPNDKNYAAELMENYKVVKNLWA